MRRKTKKINDTDLRDLLINPKLNRRGQYICDCFPFVGKEHIFIYQKKLKLLIVKNAVSTEVFTNF